MTDERQKLLDYMERKKKKRKKPDPIRVALNAIDEAVLASIKNPKERELWKVMFSDSMYNK